MVLRADLRAVQVVQKPLLQDLVDERGLAGAGNARHADEPAEREVHRDILQVVRPRAAHRQHVTAARAPRFRHGDGAFMTQVLPGQRGFTRHDLFGRARRHDLAAVHAGAGTDVHDVVGGAHRFLVVLDDDQRVAEIAQPLERFQKPCVVALMQPDAGLVEDVQNADESAADLRGETDALAFAAGQRRRPAREREVVQTDVHEEAEPCVELLQDRRGDRLLRGRKRQFAQEIARAPDVHIAQVGDVDPADRDRERGGLQALALAVGARDVRHEGLDLRLRVVARRFAVTPLHIRHDALERRHEVTAAEVALVAHLHLFLRAVHQHVASRLRDVGVRRVEREAVPLGDRFVIHIGKDVARAASPARRADRAFVDRQRFVRHDQRRVDLHLLAEAETRRTRAERVVERERARRKLLERDAAVRAGVVLREQEFFAVLHRDDREVLPERERVLERFGEPAFDAVLQNDAVDDRLDRVLFLLVERGDLLDRIHLAVDAHAHVALALQPLEDLSVLALSSAHARRDDLHPRAVRKRPDLIHDRVDRLAFDHPAAVRAVRDAAARVQQTQIVVDLRDRSDRRTRVVPRALLIDRDRGRKPVDAVDVGLVHLSDEHARVRGQALDVAPLSLRVDRVERERRFARAGNARHDHELVPRDRQIDVL